MENKLDCCPICGGSAELHKISKHQFYIKCTFVGCGIRYPANCDFTSEKGAIETWNNPHLKQQLKAKDELIGKAIDELVFWKQMAYLRNDLNDHNLIECTKATDQFIEDLEKSLKGE